jgi:hypothetical protein
MRCPNKSASGNRSGQNDPHPPAIDDKDLIPVTSFGGRHDVAKMKPMPYFFEVIIA